MIIRQDGRGDKSYEIIKDQKDMEMEERRRYLEERRVKKSQLRKSHIEEREATEKQRLQQIVETADLKIRQSERTQKLAEELARRKHIELQETLKSKKAKSAAASLSTDRCASIEAEFVANKKRCEKLDNATTYDAWPFTENSPEMLHAKKLEYKRDLQNQLINNRLKLREIEEEKHRERKIMEEAGETMKYESIEAEKKRKDTIALLQAERDAFLKARQFWKEKRREVLQQEHDEVARTIAKNEALERRETMTKTEREAAKDAMVEKMAHKLMEGEAKKLEREEICMELYKAQKENEFMKDEKKRLLKKKHVARELLQDMARHQKVHAERKAKEIAIDAAFAKYMADERKKQLETDRQKEHACRERYLQYGNELRETITKNKVQREKEAAQRKFEKSEVPKFLEEPAKVKCFSESTLDTLKMPQTNNA